MKPFILDIHYAKRFPSVSLSFGLFIGEYLEGVITFGTPPSATLRNGICGPEFSGYVLELNRLVLKNNINGHASFLVSGAIRELNTDAIVVSFADTSQGHTGVVYQAANFLYCGLSAKRTDWKVKGKEHLHGQTIADEFRGKAGRAALMREKYGSDFYLAPRSRNHRYIIFTGSKGFKSRATKALRYARETYPKRKDATNAD